MTRSRMSVLVMSCDQYSDMWNPMSDFLRKFWPDCPYEIILSTELGKPASGTVFNRIVNSNRSAWSGRVLDTLESIQTKYTMLLLDDMWPSKRIDNVAIECILDMMEHDHIGDVHLREEGTNQRDYSLNPAFRVYADNAPYRISASASIWDTGFLKSVLRPKESAWEFERIGSYREEGKLLPVLVCKSTPLSIVCVSGAVEQGKWEQAALDFAAEHQVAVDSGKRPIKSKRDRFRKSIKNFIYNANPSFVLMVQNWIYRIGQHSKKDGVQ